jgi:hypothetical protein
VEFLEPTDEILVVQFVLERALRFYPAVQGQLMFVGLGLSEFFGNAFDEGVLGGVLGNPTTNSEQSTRSLAPMPVTGISIASMSCGAAPFVSTSTIASPPRMPGSTPRIL